MIANSRLSIDENIFYLFDSLRLAPGESSTAQVVGKDDQSIILSEGIYKFIALPIAKQKLIYGEKKYELDIIPPEQISQIDIKNITQLQESLQDEAEKNSYNQLPAGTYINKPLAFNIGNLKYIRMDDKQVGLRLFADYQWVKISMEDLINLSMIKLANKVSEYKLRSAEVEIVKQNDNDAEKIIAIDVIWSILE